MDIEFRPAPGGVLWAGRCAKGPLTFLVRSYALGQYRIQITDSSALDFGAPPGHGAILQEMCTYSEVTARSVTHRLAVEADPLAYARSLATPWNTDSPRGGRIRLDTTEKDFHDGGYRWDEEDALAWIEGRAARARNGSTTV